jgi:hypothetical protein
VAARLGLAFRFSRPQVFVKLSDRPTSAFTRKGMSGVVSARPLFIPLGSLAGTYRDALGARLHALVARQTVCGGKGESGPP